MAYKLRAPVVKMGGPGGPPITAARRISGPADGYPQAWGRWDVRDTAALRCALTVRVAPPTVKRRELGEVARARPARCPMTACEPPHEGGRCNGG